MKIRLGLKHEAELARCSLNWRDAFIHIKKYLSGICIHLFLLHCSWAQAPEGKISIPPGPAQERADAEAWQVIWKPWREGSCSGRSRGSLAPRESVWLLHELSTCSHPGKAAPAPWALWAALAFHLHSSATPTTAWQPAFRTEEHKYLRTERVKKQALDTALKCNIKMTLLYI